MFLKADMTQSLVEPILETGKPNPAYPKDCMCKSGHTVPFGTRFLYVSGPAVELNRRGLYCEPCLIVANKMAAYQKAGRHLDFDPEAELQRLLKDAENA